MNYTSAIFVSEYLENLTLLNPENSNKSSLKALDLFAGCGGLALGFEAAGFETIGYELDADAVRTYNKNLAGTCEKVCLTRDTRFPTADIIIGGPPCQPFSVGGHQKGLNDARDGFPAFISAVKQVRPRFWMFENVRGMMYRNKRYLNEIVIKLESMGYQISYELLKSVDFEVPQNRERLVVVGHKGDFYFPSPARRSFTAGEAISDIAYSVDSKSKILTKSQDNYIAKYEKASKCINPRDLNLNKPSRTVTCRNLAGATGDMLRVKLPDGRRKRLTVREGARLQSFPDWFAFHGSEISKFNQIGNAVPPMMAYHIASAIKAHLFGEQLDTLKNKQLAFL